MIRAAENNLLVEIEKKFQDSAGNILVDTTWHPEEYATIEGIVRSVPVRITTDREVIGTINTGDKIFFSYGVIFDYTSQPDDDTPVYRNLIVHKGREYWKVDMAEVFCKIGKARIEMITNHVVVDPTSAETGYLIGLPPGMNCTLLDKVCFDARFVQEYNIFGKLHYIVPARKVLAKLN